MENCVKLTEFMFLNFLCGPNPLLSPGILVYCPAVTENKVLPFFVVKVGVYVLFFCKLAANQALSNATVLS